MKHTPFHARTAPLNRTQMWFNWDLYIVPDAYVDMHKELGATRTAASVGDMSPLSKYIIRGPGAGAFLDGLVTRDLGGLDVGHVIYTPWTDERGMVVGDGLVFRTGGDEYRLTSDPQLDWLTRHAPGFDVAIDDVTDEYGLLAVQGPRSAEVMDALAGGSWADMAISRTRTISVAGVNLLVARQGFTGERGYEMWVTSDTGPQVWDAVLAAGERSGIRPVGEHAIDVARVEAGLLIVGADYAGAGPDRAGSVIDLSRAHEASPFDLGLASFVDLGKETNFVGRAALDGAKTASESQKRLVGLEVDEASLEDLFSQVGRPLLLPDRVWWYPMEVSVDGRHVGHATSVTWAPTIGKIIGFGHLDEGVAAPGREVLMSWMLNDVAGDVAARVVELPFMRLRRAD